MPNPGTCNDFSMLGLLFIVSVLTKGMIAGKSEVSCILMSLSKIDEVSGGLACTVLSGAATAESSKIEMEWNIKFC